MDEMNYDKMGKDALRAEMRDRELSYSRMNNDAMRAALRADDASHAEFSAQHTEFEMSQAELDAQEGRQELQAARGEGSGLDLLSFHSPEQPVVQLSEQDKQAITDEAASRPKPAPRTRKGVTIERDREERNGVKRPSKGGVCREVWDACDQIAAAGGVPAAKTLRQLAEGRGWNTNNAMIEFYQWRKFNGITGRAK
jgi:hypothetical protein